MRSNRTTSVRDRPALIRTSLEVPSRSPETRSADFARPSPVAAVGLEREVAAIETALADRGGPTDRRDLAALVGARFWGPGRYGAALRAAVATGRARRVSRNRFERTSTPAG